MSFEFETRYGILDKPTPKETFMTGVYKQSFAYFTLRERLPVTLTSIIDLMTKDKDEIAEKYGGNSREEIKYIIGLISKLKYQLQTDKPLECFEGNEPDSFLWNTFISKLPPGEDSFFHTCWLYAECYVYRKLSSFFEGSRCIRNYDYFAKQKMNALEIGADALKCVALATRDLDDSPSTFRQLMKLNLWGNRCDLSITSGKEVKPHDNPFDVIVHYDETLLIEDALLVWHCLANPENKTTGDNNGLVVVEYICDNAGYELFTDFILAEHIIEKKLASKVRFNVKAIPWFISDVTPNDFFWTLKYLQGHDSKVLKELGHKWSKMVNEGLFELAPTEHFWTSPYEFYRMPEINPDLYEQLSRAHLLIFKGDLNYRKLIGDFTWDFTEKFRTCLRGFLPTNLCSLRTVKADLICGLQPGKAKQLSENDPKWMLTGEYGTIQFVKKVSTLTGEEEKTSKR